jgi:hypothetical protein
MQQQLEQLEQLVQQEKVAELRAQQEVELVLQQQEPLVLE